MVLHKEEVLLPFVSGVRALTRLGGVVVSVLWFVSHLLRSFTEDASMGSTLPESVLRGHAAEVMSAAFAWDDSTAGSPTLLSAGSDGEVRLWSLQTFRPLAMGAAHPGSSCLTVRALAGRRVLTHGRDGFVRLWDASDGKLLRGPVLELPSTCYNFCTCAVSAALEHQPLLRGDDGDGDDSCAASAASPLLALPNEDAQELLLWDLRQRKCVRSLAPSSDLGKAGMCMCVRFAARDALLVSGWEDGSLQVFDLRGATPTLITGARRVHTEPVLCLDVDKRGEYALSGAADCALCVTPLAGLGGSISGAPAPPREPGTKLSIPLTNEASGSGGLASVSLRPDGKVFASGGWDRRVRIWQWKKFKPLAVLQQHTGTVNAVSFSGCSKWLASASSDGTLALWSLFPPKSPRGTGSKEPDHVEN